MFAFYLICLILAVVIYLIAAPVFNKIGNAVEKYVYYVVNGSKEK